MRWYDAVTGRWLSKDPKGIAGGLNLYAFCREDPVNFCDPSGLMRSGPSPLNDDQSKPSSPEEDDDVDLKSIGEGVVNGAAEGYPYGESVGILGIIPVGAAVKNQIDALNKVTEALCNSAVETNDRGHVLADEEKSVRRNGQAVDDATNVKGKDK